MLWWCTCDNVRASFYNGYEGLPSQLEGIKPDQDLHDTFLDIEPMTGVALAAHKRIQVNLKMDRYRHFTAMEQLPSIDLFPILWADEGAELDEEGANDFKDMVETPIQIVNGLSIGLGIVVGSVLFVIGVITLMCSGGGKNY